MKRIAFMIVALLLAASIAMPQERAAYRITYDCDALYSKARKNYRWAVDIGSQTAVFYNTSMRAFLKDMDMEEALKVNDQAQALNIIKRISASYPGRQKLEVLVDRPKGEYTYSNAISQDRFIYREPLPEIEWETDDSVKTICDYPCRKAIGKVYGREWTVWYAPEIPLPFGPYVLGGLPGLILDASDSDAIFHFTAVGIEEAPEGTTVNILHFEKAMGCSRKKYLAMRKSDDSKTYAESYKGSGKIVVKDAQGKDITNAQKPKKNYLDVE